MNVVIPATAAHKPIVRASVSMLAQLMPGVAITIVTPSPRAFKDIAYPQLSVHDDREFELIDRRSLRDSLSIDKQPTAGWYYQQFLKFAIALRLPGPSTLILDADTVLLRDVRDSKPVFYTTREFNEAYFVLYERLLGRSRTLSRSAVANFMTFDRDSLRTMLDEVESRASQPWWKAVVDIANTIASKTAFSEYETYANWYCALRPDSKLIKLRLFRRGDLLLGSDAPPVNVIETARRKNYDAIAFESAHRTTLKHRLLARAAFAASACPW